MWYQAGLIFVNYRTILISVLEYTDVIVDY